MSDDWKVAKGTALEDIVAKLLRGWGFDIQTRVRAQDKSGVEHEIDVLGKKVEAFGDFTLAVECKNHVEPIDIVQIRNFNDKLSSLGYSKGLFISTGGFTPPASQYAKSVGIEVWDNPRLRENLEKAKSTADVIPYALPIAAEFNGRIVPPLANADKLQVVDVSIQYSPHFFVTWHCFTQQWINYQLTNLESEGLAVVDALSGEIVDLEVRGGVAPQMPQSKNFVSCARMSTSDVPRSQSQALLKSNVTESEARQKVQLEVTKNTWQTYSYQTGRGKYTRTEQKTIRPKVSDVSITSAKMVNIPIATITLAHQTARYQRIVQAATVRVMKDDFWFCSAERKSPHPPQAICEECGTPLCSKHFKRCKVCAKYLCKADAVEKGFYSKFYCKAHSPGKH